MTYDVRKSAETTHAEIIAARWRRTYPRRMNAWPLISRTAEVAFSVAFSAGRSERLTLRPKHDHQDPQDRQVDDRAKKQAACVGDSPGARELHRESQEEQPKHQRAGEVGRVGHADERGREAHGQKRAAVEDR